MTLTIKVEAPGLDETIDRLSAMPERVEAELGRAMVQSVFLVESAVKILTPRVTGRLFSSIQGEVFSPLQGRVSSNVRYAPLVEVGRGPVIAEHTTAKGRPGYLKFRIGGRTIFRRSVRPTRGRRMFLEGLRASWPEVRQVFRDAIKRAVGR